MKAADVSKALRLVATPKKAKANAWFFKSGPGEYAEGDKFLGVTVPEQRKIAKQHKDLSLSEVKKLVTSSWHEERLTGLFILVDQFKHGDEKARAQIYKFYLNHTGSINNWDLVDSSASYIVGPYLENLSEKMKVLTKLAGSKSLWERRIAMIATGHYIYQGRADEALIIAETLVDDNHDLIQKAVGWMLREIGKRVGREPLLKFLDRHAATMPRTALRYAIEHFEPRLKAHYMSLAKSGI